MEPDQPVGRRLAEAAARRLFERPGDLGAPLYLRHDVLVQIDGVGSGRPGGEEVIEGRHALHVDPGQAEAGGDIKVDIVGIVER